MQPAHTPSEPDESQKYGPYAGVPLELVKMIKDPALLMVVIIALLLLGAARGTPDFRYIATVIAILTFSVIIVVRLARVDLKQQDQQKQINELATYSMSTRVFRHLAGITILNEYLYRQNEVAKHRTDGKDEHGEDVVGDLFMREFYDLKNRGFIGPSTLEFTPGLHKKNIARNAQPTNRAEPTNLGLTCLKLRKDDLLEIRDDDGNKWVANITKMRSNLNLSAVKELGLKVNDDDTISAS
jgi:hypothetical protein